MRERQTSERDRDYELETKRQRVETNIMNERDDGCVRERLSVSENE